MKRLFLSVREGLTDLAVDGWPDLLFHETLAEWLGTTIADIVDGRI